MTAFAALTPRFTRFPLSNTKGMIYPAWYPDCEHLAVEVTGAQVASEIDDKHRQIVERHRFTETQSLFIPIATS
jgi:hypothetical protein